MQTSATKRSVKYQLFGVSAPNFSDASTPPNGDYASYVEHLMRWAEQEQSRQRSRDAKTAFNTANQWNTNAANSSLRKSDRDVSAKQVSQPNGVESDRMQRIKQKVVAQAGKNQRSSDKVKKVLQQLSASSAGAKSIKSKKAKIAPFIFIVFIVFIVFDIFPHQLLPFVIVAWVVFSVIHAKSQIKNNR